MASKLALDLLERRAWMRGRPRQGQPPQEKIPTSCVERGREVMAMQDSPRQPIPIRQRRLDLLFVAFFLLNFGFITYVVDLEQVVIAGPARFSYPLWPPAPLVDLVHWYGTSPDHPAWTTVESARRPASRAASAASSNLRPVHGRAAASDWTATPA